MDGDKVVHLSLREFAKALLPVPHDLVHARFSPRRMEKVTAELVAMVENYKDSAWDRDSDRYLHPEDQLAVEFTQIVNEHILGHAVAGGDASQPEGVMSLVSSQEGQETGLVNAIQVPGYVMQVFPCNWRPRDPGDVIRPLDDEPKDVSLDADDEHEGELGTAGGSGDDDRRWSTAALFGRECQPELEPEQPNWAYQSAFVQFTPEGAHNDPFDFPSLADEEEIADDRDYVADNRGRIRRQMQSCADNIALYQHRTGVFSLLVGPRTFRVVRWDRSANGVVVSERVDYVCDARGLVEVLLALVVADREGMGYDATATRILEGSEEYELMDRVVEERYWRGFVLPWAEDAAPPADAETTPAATRRVLKKDNKFVFRYVLDYFRRSLHVARGHGFLRYKLAVGRDKFLVGAPLFYYPTHPGSLRGYVAFHKQSGRFVFLKDYWRPHSDPGGTATLEGDTLRRLNEGGVGNVPTLVCHAVVDGKLSRALNIHELEDTRDTRDTAFEDEPRGVKRTQDDLRKEVETTPQTRHYVHYRIVVKEVCLPLTAVTSSRQLVSVVGDCIQAHYDATEKSRLIHGNISNESIVILPTFSEHEDGEDHTLRVVWRGVLADWEFARAVPQGQHDASESAPRPERTPGAWRHMSVASLMNSASHVLTTADELESFFHVVLHHAIRFFPHNVNATDFINTSFVPDRRDLAGRSDGGADAVLCPLNKEIIVAELGVVKLRGKKVVFYRDSQSGTQSAGNRNAPLNRLLSTMLRWLKARYDVLEYESSATAPSNPTSGLNCNTVTHLPAKRPRDEPRSSNQNDAASTSITTSGGPSESSSASEERDAGRPSDKTYELASRVDDHEAVRKLFEEVLESKDWPVNDVVEDQWIK